MRLKKSKKEIETFIKECLGGDNFEILERNGMDEKWITVTAKEEPYAHIRFCFPKGTHFKKVSKDD